MALTTKEMLDALAQWLSAIGTVGAVIVALYLSRAENRPDLVIRSGIKKIFGPKWKPNDDRDYLHLSATNLGRNDVKITHLIWRMGIFKKSRFIQKVEQTEISAGLPRKISHGDEIDIIHPIDEIDITNSPITQKLRKALFPNILVSTLQFGFHTSVGVTFWGKPDARIAQRHLDEAKKKAA